MKGFMLFRHIELTDPSYYRHPELTLFPLSVTPEGRNPESSRSISGSNKTGFTLLELLSAILIITILTAAALPYYYNAVENARITEVVMLWGRQKNFASGRFMSQEQADRMTKRLQEEKLKNFTGNIICRGEDSASTPCWEAVFTQSNSNPHAAYELTTVNNFMHLACVPLNPAGKDFCQTQAEGGPITIDGKEAYLIR